MVNIRKRAVVVLWALILFSEISNASPQLFLFLNESDQMLGRPVRAELYGISLTTKITDVNLEKLTEQFGVVTNYVINDAKDKRWPNKSIQILKFKLYPRKTGIISIPQLSADNALSQKQSINIVKGDTSVPEVRFSNQTIFERQQIIVHFFLKSTNSSSRLSLKKEQAIPGFDVTALPFKRIKQKNGTYLLQIGWAISAIKAGNVVLDFPPVEYSISGVSRKQFYLPKKIMSITPLPTYLPPTLPVGKISIESEIQTNSILQTDSLSYWNIQIKGELNNSYNLPPVLRKIKSNNKIKFYPAKAERSKQTTENKLISLVQYSIPFKPQNSGLLSLPELNLQYFDPDKEKIVSLNHKTNTILVLSIFWRSIIFVLMFFILSYFSFIGYKKWNRLKYSNINRRQAMAILKQSNSVGNIREAIHLIAKAEYWPKNLTFYQWAEYWRNRYHTNNDFEGIITKLSLLFYGSDKNINIQKQSQQLLNLITEREKH